MRDSRLRSDVHGSLHPLARPIPGLLSYCMDAVRAKPVQTSHRASVFRNLAGAAAVVLALTLVGVLVLRNASPYTPGAPAVQSAVWPEDLTLTGDINAHATTTVPNSGGIRSSCTGKYGKTIGLYQLTLAINTDHGVWQLWVIVDSYSGPGTYTVDTTRTDKARPLHGGIVDPTRTRDWTAGPGDSFTFTVDPGGETGTINATFSQPQPPVATSTPETVSGSWSCRSSE